MTDLDPLESPPAEGSDLPDRVARDQRGDRPRRGTAAMRGPTGHAYSTESAGDPDRASIASGADAGAGAGALAGTAIAGPFGLPVGAAVGGAAGAAAEAADADSNTNETDDALSDPASRGTGPVDPAEASGTQGRAG